MTEMTNDFHNIQARVRDWAREKGLDGPENVLKQTYKLQEELDELMEEVFLLQPEKAKMELGDCLVVCAIIAMKLGSDVEECIGMAYEKIRNRKGKTVDGVFRKEE